MFLYAIGAEARFIKFGITNSPRKRLTILATGCPLELSLLAKLEVPEPEALSFEAAVHIAASAHSIRGEWFKSVPPTLKIVAWMEQGDAEYFRKLIVPLALHEMKYQARQVSGVERRDRRLIPKS